MCIKIPNTLHVLDYKINYCTLKMNRKKILRITVYCDNTRIRLTVDGAIEPVARHSMFFDYAMTKKLIQH